MTTAIAAGADKKALRTAMKATLKELPASHITTTSAAACGRAFMLDAVRKASGVSVYLPMPRGECDTTALRTALFASGKAVYVPRVDGRGRDEMRMLRVSDAADLDAFPRSNWGIPEPTLEQAASMEDGLESGAIDLVIVPAVAFDARCQRLGHGRGYYGARSTRGRARLRPRLTTRPPPSRRPLPHTGRHVPPAALRGAPGQGPAAARDRRARPAGAAGGERADGGARRAAAVGLPARGDAAGGVTRVDLRYRRRDRLVPRGPYNCTGTRRSECAAAAVRGADVCKADVSGERSLAVACGSSHQTDSARKVSESFITPRHAAAVDGAVHLAHTLRVSSPCHRPCAWRAHDRRALRPRW